MTLTELKRKTLEKLRVVAAGEPASADDTAVIAGKYTALHSTLIGMGLASWTVTDPVPDDASESIIMALAYLAAPEFGANQAEFVQGVIGAIPLSLSESQLRQMHSPEYVSYPQATEYF